MYNKQPTGKDNMFFYGSLRKGDYNHSALEGNEPVAFAKLKGFKMYSLGAYPFITKTDNKSDIIVGEIYSDLDDSRLNQIDGMELGAGYHRELVKVIDTNGKEHEVIVYAMDSDSEWHSSLKIVEDGDWLEYKNSLGDD